MYFIYNAPNLYMQAVKTIQHTQQVVQNCQYLAQLEASIFMNSNREGGVAGGISCG